MKIEKTFNVTDLHFQQAVTSGSGSGWDIDNNEFRQLYQNDNPLLLV